jgi:hypothetical protein
MQSLREEESPFFTSLNTLLGSVGLPVKASTALLTVPTDWLLRACDNDITKAYGTHSSVLAWLQGVKLSKFVFFLFVFWVFWSGIYHFYPYCKKLQSHSYSWISWLSFLLDKYQRVAFLGNVVSTGLSEPESDKMPCKMVTVFTVLPTMSKKCRFLHIFANVACFCFKVTHGRRCVEEFHYGLVCLFLQTDRVRPSFRKFLFKPSARF